MTGRDHVLYETLYSEEKSYFEKRIFWQVVCSSALISCPDCHQQQGETALSGSKVTSLGAVDDDDGLQKAFIDECSLLIIGEWADWLSRCQIKALKQSIMGYQINVNQPEATWHLTTDKMEDRKSCDISSTRHLTSQQPRCCVTGASQRGYKSSHVTSPPQLILQTSKFDRNYEGPFLVVVHAPPTRPRVNDRTCLPILRSRDFLSATEIDHLVRSCSRSHGEISYLDMHTNSHSLWSIQRVIMSSMASLFTIWCFLFL